MNNVRIAAYITSYEDKKALEDCIACILSQTYPVKQILIVDNSQKQVDLAVNSKVIVRHYPENIGISGGLKIGVEWAIAQEYDFLWTFDQDSQPEKDCLINLINEYLSLSLQGEKIGIIAPLSFDSNTGIELHGGVFDRYRFTSSNLSYSETYKCDVVITSGSLLSIEASKHADMPELGLFIDAVDWDYCINLGEQGYGIFMTKKAVMKHRFSNLEFINIPFSSFRITLNNYSPLRIYYISRNHTYLTLKSAKPLFSSLAVAYRLIHFVKSSIKILLFEADKLEKIRLGALGTSDGLLKRLGKKVL